MLLATYLAKHGKTDEAFSREIGISRSQVTRLRHRKTCPSFKTAIAIQTVTEGKVTIMDMRREVAAEAAE